MAAPSTATLGSLPTRLMDFFAKYPPKLYSAQHTRVLLPLTRKEAKEARIAASRQEPPIPAAESSSSDDGTASPTETRPAAPVPRNGPHHNPFLPFQNPHTGKWRSPRYSLRRQAELCKLAKKYGVEELLPPSRKSAAFKEARALQKGLRVKGTGEGQEVKGHKWERTQSATLQKRRKAMEGMPEMIRLWKQVSTMVEDCVLPTDVLSSKVMAGDGRSIPNNTRNTSPLFLNRSSPVFITPFCGRLAAWTRLYRNITSIFRSFCFRRHTSKQIFAPT